MPIRATAAVACEAVGHGAQRADRHDGLVGVAAAGRAEVGDDAPPEPRADRRPAPTSSTTPATSRPGVVGSGGGGSGPGSPRRIDVSRRCTPDASTATRTWSGPGWRSGRSSSAQHVGGTELVVADGLHGSNGTTSSSLEVKAVPVGPADGRRVTVPRVQLTETTWPTVGDRPVLCIPVGSCEQHGPHLPLDTDTIIAEALAARLAARRPGVVVGPSLTVTASGEHAGFPGTLSIGTDATATVIVELVRSADWSGGVVLVNGHGGNRDAVDRAMTTLDRDGRAALPVVAVHPGGDAHAGRTETSLLLALRPDLVRLELAAAGETAPLAVISSRLRAIGVRGVSPERRARRSRPAPSADEGAACSTSSTGDLLRAVDDVAGAGGRDDATRSTARPGARPGSNVVIGGSPLRLFRLTDAGVAVFDDIAAGARHHAATARAARLVDRLVDAGAIHPHPACGPFTAADVTVVVPAFVLGESALAEIVRCCAGVAGVIAVDDASDPPVAPSPASRVLRLRTNAGPAVARNAGLGRRRRPRSSPSSTPTCASSRAGSTRCSATSPTTASALVAPRVASAPGAGPIAAYEQGHSPLDLGPGAGPHRPGHPPQLRPGGGDRRAHRAPCGRSTASTGGLRFGEDVDAVWRLVEAGWRCRYEPASVVHHRPARVVARRWSPSASPTARRPPRCRKRHPGALAPVRISGWSGAAWGLLAAGQPIPARRRRRRHDAGPGAQAARRAGQGVAAPRRARPPLRRAPARRRRAAGVVAAAAGRRRRLEAGARGRRRRPPCRRC